MRLLVCLEGPLLAEELVSLMDAVTDIAPEATVEMRQNRRPSSSARATPMSMSSGTTISTEPLRRRAARGTTE